MKNAITIIQRFLNFKFLQYERADFDLVIQCVPLT